MDRLTAAFEKKFPKEKTELLVKAINFAKSVHADQKRESQEPYYIHPEAVALILLDMDMDADTVIAGLLHDTVEDGHDITVENIAQMFGKDIARMVDGVTKLTNSNLSHMLSKEDRQAENLRKMFLAIANDVRVVVIKLADRLHNMRTLGYCSKEKRVRKARETMDVYAPLADRFGMGAIKVELEDLSFSYLMPEECRRLQSLIEPKQEERMGLLKKAMHKLEIALKDAGIKAEVSGRRKHIYSIYRKLNIKKVGLNEIYDLVALRIIVDTVQDCYGALGIVHSLWRPFPGRFKDYISMPKTNMYRSLHTTLFSDLGMPFEVQIRTWEMHRTAEYGIAAHWKYKEASNGGNVENQEEEKLSWLRQILEWQKDMSDNREFMSLLKSDLDLFSDTVFCFTPSGDVKNLPTGSTPIDFAYAIHSAVGNRMVGCKVNNRMVPIDHVVSTGEIIEVLLGPADKGPSRDWLKIVRTSEAKSKIRNWFKKMRREENIQQGRDALAKELRREMIFIPDDQLDEFVGSCSRRLRQNNAEEIYAAIGYGGMTIANCLPKLKEEWQKLKAAEAAENKSVEDLPKVDLSRVHATDGVVVEGFDNTPIKFAKCCSPLPGDPIVGFITRGFGVSIHKQSCANAVSSMKDPSNAPRWVKAYWADSVKDSYKAGLEIVALDRNELLRDVLSALADIRVPIYTMNARQVENNCAVVSLTIGINNTEHLNRVVARLSKVKDVLKVTRS